MHKKISIFTPYLSKTMGGIQNLSFNLFKYLKEYVKVSAYSGNINENEKIKGVYYSKYNNSQIKIGYDLLKKSYYDFKRNKSNINIALTWKLGIITYLLNKLYNVPYIVYVHGNDIYPDNKNFVEKHVIKTVLKNATKIIANSKYTKKLCNTYGEFNIKVIHPGIDYKNIKINNKNEVKNRKILFTLSRLEKRKGIDNTLRAMPKIISRYPDIHYYIGGKGPYNQKLKQIVSELNIENHVTFLGFISEEQKDEMYKKCDLFVMPSYEVKEDGSVEGFGIVYLEANMYGKFVIAGNSGGTLDAVNHGKTGLIVDGDDPKSISEGIIKFYEEYYNKKNYQKDCIRWAEKHDWNNIINYVLGVLD